MEDTAKHNLQSKSNHLNITSLFFLGRVERERGVVQINFIADKQDRLTIPPKAGRRQYRLRLGFLVSLMQEHI